MDSVLNTNNLVSDFVTVIAAEQCNRAAALPGRADFSCCIHTHYSWVQLVSGRRDCCCRKPSSEVPGCLHRQCRSCLAGVGSSTALPVSWSICVAASPTLMDLTPGLPRLLSLPHWDQRAGLEPSGSGPPSWRHAAARKE